MKWQQGIFLNSSSWRVHTCVRTIQENLPPWLMVLAELVIRRGSDLLIRGSREAANAATEDRRRQTCVFSQNYHLWFVAQ